MLPCELLELIESMPAMVENSFSSGVATAEAIVSGLAPGYVAETMTVGKSTFGRSLTGSRRYPMTPKSTMLNMTSVVVTGRWMYSDEILTAWPPPAWFAGWKHPWRAG